MPPMLLVYLMRVRVYVTGIFFYKKSGLHVFQAFVSNQTPTSSGVCQFHLDSCAWFSPLLRVRLCANRTCVLVCVPRYLYMRVCKCVLKVTNINKCMQNRDDVRCIIKVEM